jgi:hypothetical protein
VEDKQNGLREVPILFHVIIFMTLGQKEVVFDGEINLVVVFKTKNTWWTGATNSRHFRGFLSNVWQCTGQLHLIPKPTNVLKIQKQFRPLYPPFVMHLPGEGHKSGQSGKKKYYHHHHHRHHHQAVMELGHLMIRSGLKHPESLQRWFLLPLGSYFFIILGNLLRGILFTYCGCNVQWCVILYPLLPKSNSHPLLVYRSHKRAIDDRVTAVLTVSSGMGEMPFQNMPVQRLQLAILPLDLPCSRLVIHSGEITAGKS